MIYFFMITEQTKKKYILKYAYEPHSGDNELDGLIKVDLVAKKIEVLKKSKNDSTGFGGNKLIGKILANKDRFNKLNVKYSIYCGWFMIISIISFIIGVLIGFVAL